MQKLQATVWLAAVFSATVVAHANLNGPPPGYTGAPGEETCSAAGCHDVSSGRSGKVRVQPIGAQDTDTVEYRVILTNYDGSIDDWGFQLTMLDSLAQPFGTMLVLDSIRTKLTTDSTGNSYLSHTTGGVPGGFFNSYWDLRWVRPTGALITDSVYFYVSGLLADGDGTAMNDAVITSIAVGPFCRVAMTGDVNESSSLTAADIIYMIGHVFKGGAMPQPCAAAGDGNCDGTITSADIIALVAHIFKSGPPPCDVCPLIIDGTWACP